MANSPINPNNIFIPTGVLADSSDKKALNLKQWLIAQLVGLGAITIDPCCTIKCTYDVSDGTFPTTLTSITIDGVTYALGGNVITVASDIVSAINTLGLGQFNYNPVTDTIGAPKNGRTYGDIVTDDDTFTNTCG